MVSTDLQTHMVSLSEIVPYVGNAKEHPEWQVDQIAASIEQFGNCDPIGVWHNDAGELEVVEGHGRLMAARSLGMTEVPCIRLDHLTDEQRKEYAIRHNRSAEFSTWDFQMLAEEVEKLEMEPG